jgi:energy-coupling factor transport system substrate-specific component
MKADKWKRRIVEMCVFSMLGALMFCSKIIMEALPNIHLLGMFVITFTLVFRVKALIPIYVYVILNGLYAGFNLWWVPYLYIWTILWAITMILPKKMPRWLCSIVYPAVCALHGLAYGILYSPAQALMFHLNFEQTIAWIIAGFPFDLIHCIGNLFTGLLVLPLSELLKRLSKSVGMA